MAGGGGGAWKVAYADFVTAMMALFMVLWISSQDQKILIATSQYFQNPFHSPINANSGVMPFNSNKTTHSEGRDQGEEKESDKSKRIPLAFLNSVAADFYRLLHLDENLADKPIDIQVTSDGLKVTLFDRARQPLFESNTAKFTPWGTFVLQNLAWMIDRHKFRVTIDGHIRSGLPMPQPDYTGWELSADRANASRRLLLYYAVAPELFDRVSGYSDTRPLPKEDPTSEANQRITLSLAVTSKAPVQDSAAAEKPPAAAVAAPRVTQSD